MSFFRAYLLQRRRELLLLALCAVLFFVTFFLYNLPLGAVLYPTVLCMLAGAAFALASWRRAKQKHERLRELSRLPAALMDRFPPPAGADDEDYQAVIEALRREQAELRSESARRTALRRAEAAVVEEARCAPLCATQRAWLCRPEWEGVALTPAGDLLLCRARRADAQE